jgi:hypothetical protein
VNPLRRAALSVHGLPDADRDWVLSRLPEARRDELRRLIEELDGLGFPRGGATEVQPPPAATPPRAATPTATDRLDVLTPKALHGVLAEESPALIAALLRQRPWRWGRGLLRRLGRQRRREIATLAEAGGGAATPRVERELVALVAAAAGVGPAPGRPARDGGTE